jgi:hypothetical protein
MRTIYHKSMVWEEAILLDPKLNDEGAIHESS